MNNKTYTFIITSNRKGNTKSITITSSWLKVGVVCFSFFCVILIAGIVDYFGLLLREGENKRLRAENAQLNRQFQIVEGKVSALESGLERIKSLTTKIRLITNIEDEDRVMKLSIGTMPQIEDTFAPGLISEDQAQRAVASTEILKSDSAFFGDKPILDRARGEMASVSTRNYSTLSIRIDEAVRRSGLQEQGVIKLQELLSERQSILNQTPSIRPTRGWMTSRFGYRVDPFTGRPEMHYGLDFAAPPGTPIVAPADGVVSYVGFEAGYGKLVSIDHGYGVRTRYAHNSQIYVQLGQKVKRRDVISTVGTTGRSTGPHLHYEVRVNDIPVDPINYILDE